jgi:hypothetical protein
MLDIDSIFSYHPATTPEVAVDHENARFALKTTAEYLQTLLPECAEKTIAIRKLQEAMMFANSAIAQNS